MISNQINPQKGRVSTYWSYLSFSRIFSVVSVQLLTTVSQVAILFHPIFCASFSVFLDLCLLLRFSLFCSFFVSRLWLVGRYRSAGCVWPIHYSSDYDGEKWYSNFDLGPSRRCFVQLASMLCRRASNLAQSVLSFARASAPLNPFFSAAALNSKSRALPSYARCSLAPLVAFQNRSIFTFKKSCSVF